MYFAAQREIAETWCFLMLGSPFLPRGIPTVINDFEHACRIVGLSPMTIPGDIVATLSAFSSADGSRRILPSEALDERGMSRQRTSSVRQSETMVSVWAPPPSGTLRAPSSITRV